MANAYRFLHLEDRSEDAARVSAALGSAPFTFTCHRVADEGHFTAALDAGAPDAILSELAMGDFTAERALALLRERGLDIAFVVVSSRLVAGAILAAMRHGASDCIGKSELQRLAPALESAIARTHDRRCHALDHAALRRGDAMKQNVLDSLDSRIAVIDGNGAILEVNQSWERFDKARSELGLGSANVGANFLEILREAARSGRAFAQEGPEGIAAVVERERSVASLEYQVPTPSGPRWFRVCATPLAGSERGAVLSHTEITEQMRAHAALETANQRLQNLSTRMLSVQEDERRSIAGELHDDVGQALTALKITLHRLAEKTAPDGAALIAECLRVSDETLQRLRRLIHELRPPQLDQLGLVDALRWLVERQRDATGADIRFAFTGAEERRAPPDIEVACFRIAQEGLNNATRHAKAHRILVKLAYEDPLLKLAIEDDGAGFDESAGRLAGIQSGSLGLVGMEERARHAGGVLRLRTAIGAGTTITAQFPFRLVRPVHEEGALEAAAQ